MPFRSAWIGGAGRGRSNSRARSGRPPSITTPTWTTTRRFFGAWIMPYATADPVTPGSTGTRYFGTDTRGTIFYSNTTAFTTTIASTATPVQ